MPRYIDAEELKKRAYPFPCAIGVEYAVSVRQIDETPTADVVPKSEVDFLHKTIAENAQRALEVTLEEIEKAKSEVAREIFEEIEKYIERYWNGDHYSMYEMEKEVAELKKKYTEVKI